MLLPRFSIRTALIVFTAVAIVSLFAGQAMGGRVWAVGLTTAVLSIPAAVLVQALFFLLFTKLAGLLGVREIVARTSRGGIEHNTASPTTTTTTTTAAP